MSDELASDRHPPDAVIADGHRAKALAIALARARAELLASHRLVAELSAALTKAALHECPPPPPPPPVAPVPSEHAALYEAILRSSSWRYTRPLRVLARLLRGERPLRKTGPG